MKIMVVVDTIDSWFVPYAIKLCERLRFKHEVIFIQQINQIVNGDICFFLSCNKIVKDNILKLHTHNIVVHASDLPSGKGFSPMQWQVLSGLDEVILTLFEATEELDSGPYYFKEKIHFDGNELLYELHEKMANKIIEMCIEYVERINELEAIPQNGEESYFRKMTESDDMIDINKTLAEQFNHFRIEDNEKHPLWFEINGSQYYLKIYRKEQK